MHLESHKIFEAYVLAKSVEKQQLNEGIMDWFEKRAIKKEDAERLKTYKNLWTRFWFPRFAKKGEIKTNKEKAIDTFEKFLNSRRWADENMMDNKRNALVYFSKNHGTMDYDDVERGAIETLLYGQPSSYTPARKETEEPVAKEEPAKVVDQAAAEPAKKEEEKPKSMSLKEYEKLSDEEKSKIDASTYARKGTETVAPTPTPVASEPAAEPEEDPYKLKAEVTRLKKLNQAWIGAIKKKFGRTVRKPSDLVGKKSIVSKK